MPTPLVTSNAETRTTFIYALCEPGTKTIRYFGRSDRPNQRRNNHISRAKREGKDWHVACWIRKLLKAGHRPDVHVLCEVPKNDWARFERAFILLGRQSGFDLTNFSEGGEGTSLPGAKNPNFGKTMSEAQRAKISAGNLGTKHTPEFGAACGLRFRGKKLPPRSPEHSAKIGAALKGRKLSLEHCAKLSAAAKGKKLSPYSPERCSKISAACKGRAAWNKGIAHSTETRAKISAACKGRTAWNKGNKCE